MKTRKYPRITMPPAGWSIEEIQSANHRVRMMTRRQQYAYALYRRKGGSAFSALQGLVPTDIIHKAGSCYAKRADRPILIAGVHRINWTLLRAATDFEIVKEHARRRARVFYACWPNGADQSGYPV